MVANDSNVRPATEAAALLKMYKQGSSGETIFNLIRMPHSAGDTGPLSSFVEFRRAVLREFCRLVKRQRAKAERNGRGGRSTRKHVRRGSR